MRQKPRTYETRFRMESDVGSLVIALDWIDFRSFNEERVQGRW